MLENGEEQWNSSTIAQPFTTTTTTTTATVSTTREKLSSTTTKNPDDGVSEVKDRMVLDEDILNYLRRNDFSKKVHNIALIET